MPADLRLEDPWMVDVKAEIQRGDVVWVCTEASSVLPGPYVSRLGVARSTTSTFLKFAPPPF